VVVVNLAAYAKKALQMLMFLIQRITQSNLANNQAANKKPVN
jgi:hypothetical protein